MCLTTRVTISSTAVLMMSSVSEVWSDVGVVVGCRGMSSKSSESSIRIGSLGVVGELGMLLGNGWSDGRWSPASGNLGS